MFGVSVVGVGAPKRDLRKGIKLVDKTCFTSA